MGPHRCRCGRVVRLSVVFLLALSTCALFKLHLIFIVLAPERSEMCAMCMRIVGPGRNAAVQGASKKQERFGINCWSDTSFVSRASAPCRRHHYYRRANRRQQTIARCGRSTTAAKQSWKRKTRRWMRRNVCLRQLYLRLNGRMIEWSAHRRLIWQPFLSCARDKIEIAVRVAHRWCIPLLPFNRESTQIKHSEPPRAQWDAPHRTVA